MSFVEVIPLKSSVNWAETLTYLLPEAIQVSVGEVVAIPFGKQEILGIVIELKSQLKSGLSVEKIKPVAKVYPDLHLPNLSVNLGKWISDYYQAPIRKVMRLLLPKNLRQNQLNAPSNTYYQLTESSEKPRGSKQLFVIDALHKKSPLSFDEIKNILNSSPTAVLRSLESKNLISQIKQTVYKSFDINNFHIKDPELVLSPAQLEALTKINVAQKPVLLHGVTGSGKTEIYLRKIIAEVKAGRQALLLLPEIALTPQTLYYFRQFFGDHIAVFHSKLTDAERTQEWWKVKTGFAPVVIGSRSAIFAPIENWGVIILDEEHEWTYKQESSPHYETHQVAEFIHKKTGCSLIFASATPKVESYHKAKIGDYEYLHLPDRVQQSQMPTINIIDLREEFKKRNFSIFSLNLQNKIKERLQNQEQIILFVNQRGMANAVVCRDCGYKEECPNCEVSLKLHQSNGGSSNAAQLICHYCHYSRSPSIQCPDCQSIYIKNIGVGTQRVEQEVRNLFPSARVVRADADSVKSKSFEEIYHEFFNQKHDILIGTQMVAKGLDFSNVTLTGIILADIGLHIPDFRSSERLFQVLTQVSGRSGRGNKPGEVVLQTYQPHHPTIQKIADHAYEAFIADELKIREKLSYPPFHKIIKFTVVGFDEKLLAQHIKIEKEILEDIFNVNNLSVKIVSAPAMIPKIANRYYYQVLIRSKNPHLIFDHWKIPKGWRVDVDPVNTV